MAPPGVEVVGMAPGGVPEEVIGGRPGGVERPMLRYEDRFVSC
jgi:hypothetical protein